MNAFRRPWRALGLVLLAAAFFHLHRFDEVPPGFFASEAANGALETWRTPHRPASSWTPSPTRTSAPDRVR